ncbi:MAG: prenyltransferase [Candidatus Paceibacterota bacterium]
MQIKRLLKISRPRFWIYEIGPYIVGIAAAAGITLNAWLLIPAIIFFFFFTYPANIFIYGINDIFDYETDKLNPKKISYESLVMPEEWPKLWKNIILFCAPFLVYGFFVLNIQSFIALLAFFFFAGFYSSTPIRAKARPFLDSIFSAGHYVATAVFSYLMINYFLNQEITWVNLAIGTLAGMFWAIAMHAYSAVPDIQADRDAKLETIATKLEKNKTIILCSVLYALSGILAFKFLGIVSIILSLVYVVFMIKSIKTTDEQLFKIYTYFPKINSLSGMIIFFSVLLN